MPDGSTRFESGAATTRLVWIVVVALVSMIGGAALIWGVFKPEIVASARTGEILCILGLLLLPVATVTLLELDRRRRIAHSRRERQAAGARIRVRRAARIAHRIASTRRDSFGHDRAAEKATFSWPISDHSRQAAARRHRPHGSERAPARASRGG